MHITSPFSTDFDDTCIKIHGSSSSDKNILIPFNEDQEEQGSTVPCGTPDVTWAVSDVAPSSTTSCCLSLRNDLIDFSVLPLTP